MKNFMDNSDKFIFEKLNKEEAKLYNDLEEKNIFTQMINLFTGKNKWIMIILMVYSLVVFGFLVYSIRNFIDATELVSLIKWGSASFLCITFLIMMKIYSWMQMHNNNILREMKRFQLLLTFKTKS